ncbi:hypothetical protein BK022_03590 [Methylorubrum extorquens]|uniref:Methyltransferase type 12 n=1 Tax=Methylorubrum extorquens TaxID=408 RepID=A0A1S1P8W7_METEX|nr:hypothetical protein BK022_03590 [Methylorubrum extorquens]
MEKDDANLVFKTGHRNFIGGNDALWAAIGELQANFLIKAGLEPHHHFLDVACGSLRAGIHLIPYLDAGRYFGVDQHIELIIIGVGEELGMDAFRSKKPKFLVSRSFEFERFGTTFNWGIAQSLFTHITADEIRLCLTKLHTHAAEGMRFFATFHEVETSVANPEASHSHDYFAYTRAEMEAFGRDAGWTPRYIGEWGHPRQQKIIEYSLA